MKSMHLGFRPLRLAVPLTLGLCFGNAVWSVPSIQSIDVSPNPLTVGQPFTIAVSASPDVGLATAAVSFRPGEPRSLQIPLVKQGLIWTGSGLVPADLQFQFPLPAGALVRVLVLDALGRRAEEVIQVGLVPASISALFAGGVLTGDSGLTRSDPILFHPNA